MHFLMYPMGHIQSKPMHFLMYPMEHTQSKPMHFLITLWDGWNGHCTFLCTLWHTPNWPAVYMAVDYNESQLDFNS